MLQKTIEEIEKIRPAFSSNGKPGILEGIVRSGREKEADRIVNVNYLKERYAKLGCLGVVKLITYLISKESDVTEIGSGSIDWYGVTSGPFSPENAQSLQELYIGSHHAHLTPLQWLSYLSDGIETVIPEQRKAFDDICEELAMIP